MAYSDKTDAYYPLTTSVPASPGQSDFLRWRKDAVSEGVFYGDLNSLKINAPGGMNIQVLPGRGTIRDVFWEVGVLRTIPISPNVSGSARIDRLMVQLSAGASEVRLIVVEGTPAFTPAAPTPITATDVNGVPTIWQYSVAQIAVANGAVAILTANIIEEQRFQGGAGYSLSNAQASANALTLPDGKMVSVSLTGTTTINSISLPRESGSIVTLRFISAGCTVTHSAGLNLQGAQNFVSRAESFLTLMNLGGTWNEIGRGRYGAAQNLVVASPSGSTGEVGLRALATSDLPTDISVANLAGDVGRYNYLVNGGFEIWQRGNGTFSADGSFVADKWQYAQGAGSSIGITKDVGHDVRSRYALAAVYVHTSPSQIKQSVENWRDLVGQTVTFAVRCKGVVAGGIRASITEGAAGTTGTSLTGGAAYETLYVTRTISGSATEVSVYIELLIGGTYLIDNATLCIGSVPVSYVPLHPAEDLARCLRYYELLGAQQLGDTGTGALILSGTAAGGSITIFQTFPYAVKKAIADPTTTKNGTWTIANTLASVQPSIGTDDATAVRLQVATAAVTSEVQSANNAANANISIEANPV